jgi:hypothetical protein
VGAGDRANVIPPTQAGALLALKRILAWLIDEKANPPNGASLGDKDFVFIGIKHLDDAAVLSVAPHGFANHSGLHSVSL